MVGVFTEGLIGKCWGVGKGHALFGEMVVYKNKRKSVFSYKGEETE